MGLTVQNLEAKLSVTPYYPALFSAAFGSPEITSDRALRAIADAVTTEKGAGRGAIKSPSLRNVAVRPRFMHDGRFTTLEQVVDFFDSGVQPNPDLDSRLRASDGSPKRLGLAAAEKAALVAFLKTLTDSTFLADPRFADPFGPATNP